MIHAEIVRCVCHRRVPFSPAAVPNPSSSTRDCAAVAGRPAGSAPRTPGRSDPLGPFPGSRLG
jgi:hypothetical protein